MLHGSIASLAFPLLASFALQGPTSQPAAPPAVTPAATPGAPPATPAASQPTFPKEEPVTDKHATKDVDIKKECGVLADVARHRSALHFLKNDKDARDAILKTVDPESASSVRSIVEKDEAFTELDYHFVEKIRNCEQRILNKLRVDRFQGVADLLEATKDKTYPASASFANLMATVELNFRYAVRNHLVPDEDMVKELTPKLAAEAARVQGTSGHAIEEIAKTLWKETKPDDFPVGWFDRSSEIISYEFGVIPEAKDFPRVDLASATKEQLTAIPGLEPEMADGILKYRKRNRFVGPEELRFVEAIPATLVEPLQTVFTVDRSVAANAMPKKKWTVMVYLNAANNLEPFGVEDMNEMEKAGSTPDVNVVVECARFHGKQAVKPNGQYLANPYSEFSGAFYWGLDNSPGTRRYYILKDDDKVRIRSALVENVGDTDAGRPEPLAEFGKWAAERFPAEHYALVIWNHGAGWSGVSYDDNTHHGMDMPEVREACEGICSALKKQGKDRLDVLDFDACLMATLEVAYELRDTVDFLVASQETEPGKGMDYTEYLKWLDTYPEAPPASFAKAMVESYVRSYAPEGSQTEKDGWYGAETKSAIRESKVAELKEAVEAVAKLLLGKPDLLGDVAEEILKDTRRFGRLVDVQDFLAKVCKREKADAALKAAAERVNELIGYPDDGKDKLVNEVVIQRRSAGAVIWGFNGWATPPRSLAPFVANARWAKTPLVGPDEKGNYVARIKFPPMLRNPKTTKSEFVKSIDYRFEDEQEKRTITDFQNSFFTPAFPGDSVVVAEGHNVGNNRSHGVSLYFPAYLGFDKEYRRLQFFPGSAWAELCEKFPIKKLENPAPIALLGVNHATKADREKLGAVVVREELERQLLHQDWAAPYREDLDKLGRKFDSIRDPRPYGLDWIGVMDAYRGATVVLDNHAGGELGGGGPDLGDLLAMIGGGGGGARPKAPRIVGPEGRQVMRWLQGGGKLLLGTSAATAALWDGPLYRDTLGLEYVAKWDRDYAFTLPGSREVKPDAKLEIETAHRGEPILTFKALDGASGVEPFAVLPNGAWVGAKVARADAATGKAYRAVVLGFFLADVKGADNRRAVLNEALAFLAPTQPVTLPEAKAEPKPAPSPAVGVADPKPAPVGAGAGSGGGTRER